ncbi:MAG: Bro-N domain-containing protein [Dolichospermum sp.]|jgi:prophage antirepressor-like protein
MDSLAVFSFNSNQVRVLMIDGEPWFVAKDVAEIFDYADLSKMLNLVDTEDKDVINPKKLDSAKMAESFNSNTFKVSIINESGLYACIFGSHKPQAKEFKRWVTSQVLPAIRKSGSYPGVTPMQPEMQQIATAIDLVFACTVIDSRLIAGVKANQIAKSYPALASAMEESKTLLGIPVEKELVRPTQLAELYAQKTGLEISARRINLLLMEKGMQTKNTSSSSPLWLPTEEGKEYSQIVLDTAKGHNKTVQSLQWYPSVVDVI